MPFVQALDPTEIETLPEEKQGHGALQTAEGNLPLKAMDVKASVVGLLCKTSLRQTFVNTTKKHLEATYIFPLPDRAGVSSFRLEVGDRVINGELQERAKARQAYAQAIQTGYRAAIAEEERPDVFTMRVGNIPPGEEVSIWLDMAGPLETSAGSATYRFPLVVAPRYIPGAGLPGASVGSGTAADTDQVPDASRITPPTLLPGHASPVQLSLELDVDPAGLQTSNHRSSMEVDAFEIPGTIKLRPGQRLNQDFVFRFDFLSQEVQASLVIERDEAGGKEGTLMLTVVGPDQRTYQPPKDVIFVLDRSGSMSGWKMVAARRACADLIDKLGPQDRFDVIAFDTVQESPFADDLMAEATPHSRYVATEWLGKIGARGGTEIARPLFHALKSMPAGTEREQTIVLITDGQVGNDRGILATVEQSGFGGRIFTLGIDRSVSASFLRSLANTGDGRCELVESPERLDEVLDEFSKQIGGPLFEDMNFHVGGLCLDVDSVAPSAGHHLYPNVPTMVMARFVGLGELEHLKACIGGVVAEIEGTETQEGILSTAWARQRLRELEDKWAAASTAYGRTEADPAALERQIVEVSLAHHVLCRFTAFVAIDKSEIVNKGGEQSEITQPVEQPAGWEMGGAQMCSGIVMGQAMSSPYGAPQGGGVVRGMGMGNVGGQSMGGGGTFCSAVPMGQSPVAGWSGAPQGVVPGFSGFAPGFDPMARRSREVKMSKSIPTRRRGGMRVVPVPAVGGPPTDKEYKALLEIVTALLAWKKKRKKKFWESMQSLAGALQFLSREADPAKQISPVLRSTLNTAIAAKNYTARTKQTLETIKAELEAVLAGAARPRNAAFWK